MFRETTQKQTKTFKTAFVLYGVLYFYFIFFEGGGALILTGCCRGLFHDALNTFYLRLYGVRHMVKDHTNSERKPAAATWATLSISSKGSFICIISDRITPVVEHWLE